MAALPPSDIIRMTSVNEKKITLHIRLFSSAPIFSGIQRLNAFFPKWFLIMYMVSYCDNRKYHITIESAKKIMMRAESTSGCSGRKEWLSSKYASCDGRASTDKRLSNMTTARLSNVFMVSILSVNKERHIPSCGLFSWNISA
jgi:hypothetical protein